MKFQQFSLCTLVTIAAIVSHQTLASSQERFKTPTHPTLSEITNSDPIMTNQPDRITSSASNMPYQVDTMSQPDGVVPQSNNTPPQLNNTLPQSGNTMSQPNNTMSQSGNTMSQPNNTMSQPNNTMSQSGNMMMQPNNTMSQPDSVVPQSNNTPPQLNNTLPQSGNTMSQPNNTLPQSGNTMMQPNNTMSQPDGVVPQSNNASQLDNTLPQSGDTMSQPNNTMSQPNNTMSQPNRIVPQSNNTLPQLNNTLPQLNNTLPRSSDTMSQPNNTTSQSDNMMSPPNYEPSNRVDNPSRATMPETAPSSNQLGQTRQNMSPQSSGGTSKQGFSQAPRLIRVNATQKGAYMSSSYEFTVTVPPNAGAALQAIKVVQDPNIDTVVFDGSRSQAFSGERYANGSELRLSSVGGAQRTLGEATIVFDQPVQPGNTVTIALNVRTNPSTEGVYEFGVTAFPVGEQSPGLFLGYGRINLYGGGN